MERGKEAIQRCVWSSSKNIRKKEEPIHLGPKPNAKKQKESIQNVEMSANGKQRVAKKKVVVTKDLDDSKETHHESKAHLITNHISAEIDGYVPFRILPPLTDHSVVS